MGHRNRNREAALISLVGLLLAWPASAQLVTFHGTDLKSNAPGMLNNNFTWLNTNKMLALSGSGAPSASCTAGKAIYLDTGTGDLYYCTSADAWTRKGASGGAITPCAPVSANGATMTCSPSPALSSYTGSTLAFIPDVAGTPGAITISVSGLGPKSIKQADGASNPVAFDLVAGRLYFLSYDGTVFRSGPAITNLSMPGGISLGVGGPNSSIIEFGSLTSGGPVAIGAPNVGTGTPIVYMPPVVNGTPGQVISDGGAATCGTYPATSPTLCHQLVWVTVAGSSPPYAIASNTATATSSAAWTALAFTTNSAGSSSGLHNTSTNTTKFLVPTTGTYEGNCFYRSTSTTAGDWAVAIRLNGTNYTGPYLLPTSSIGMSGSAAMTFELTAGDYVECVVYVATGPTSADNGATFTTRMFWKGPL